MVGITINKPIRIAVIDKDKCRPDKCNQECMLYCPLERNGKEVIKIEGKAKINEEVCIGCGICVKKCPFDAITIINLSRDVGKLVHQYGENAFRLFNLPTVKEGKIVGLLGMNGTGKSTTLEIFSGRIKPNMGKYNAEVDWKEIIEAFRGNEIQSYFEKLSERKVKIVYKVQRVEEIAEIFKGKKVKELFSKIGDKGIKYLEIEDILDKRIEELSGGELQKVAIAAALSKEADFYFIDEPSSFLDIKQRLEIAEKIRNFVRDKSMIIVEHDLVIMDYLADYIHIFHGIPGAYGVVSNIYNARRGINNYIEGYIKEENIRIRDYEIEFINRQDRRITKSILFSYPSFTKKYPGFKLNVGGGEVYEGEVIGVLGENAIGKSTFMNILSGMEKDDENKVKTTIKIAYKKQKIELGGEETVEEYLYNHAKINKDIMHHIIEPLHIDKIFHKTMNKISGGELQKVYIASTLAKDVDVYFIDEPSAYLDVEHRIRVSKIIKSIVEQEGKTAVVVDHDIMMLSYLSDRVILFEGKKNKEGYASSPQPFSIALNKFLKNMGITFRRDEDTKRPKINKIGSQKDMEQKQKGVYFEE